jgi:SAM-dependent methyltransferase
MTPSKDPFLARLEEEARRAAETAEEPAEAAPTEARRSRRPRRERPEGPGFSAKSHTYRDRRAVAFWQSELAGAHIRRRISGSEDVDQASFFAGLLDDSHRAAEAASLRAGDPSLEVALLRAGACRSLVFVDPSQQKLDYARARVPEDLLAKVQFERADPAAYDPGRKLGLVVSNSYLHRVEDPEEVVGRIAGWMTPNGMVYVDEFVGPDRFQWTDRQIEIVNRLLSALPDELRADLAGGEEPKTRIARPDRERFSRDNPTEAVASSRIRAALDSRLKPVEVRPYGGAVFHQLFARIMGNFVRRPEVVRLILEVDAILTDLEVVGSDYLWAAYASPSGESG